MRQSWRNGIPMQGSLLRTTILLLGSLAVGSEARADEGANAAALQVPAGYTVELAAAPPLVAHPLMACFDEQGRLYVAANAGENLPRAELEKRLPNFVQRLEDTNGDGVFDSATVFADKMTFPQGCLWHNGSLFVASSGAIWKLTDTDDDGVAEVREKLVGDFGYTGNAADVHGPFLGPDGRIYWCEGRHGHEIKDRAGKLVSKGKAARIFSCKEDGTDVQTFCTGGMDNPVEIVFTPEGEMLGTVNLMYDRPRGDCLVHWQYGGVYPREDFAESLGAEFVRTGELLPEVHNFGHVAVSGLCRASGNQLGQDFLGSLFITQFNTNRVVRMKLKPSGSTFAVEALEDFAVSTSKDFHPTDVLEDADGSLLVIDTGGWFRIGCPQSQVEKSHIKGAIYRIRRTAKTPIRDPAFGFRAELLKLQEDTWKLANDGSRESLNQLLLRMYANEPTMRATAVRALSDRKIDDPRDWELLLARGFRVLMLHRTGPDCRIAAPILGRFARQFPSATSILLERLQREEHDPLVRHALVLGLIESGNRKLLSQSLLDEHESVRTAAAIALEQLRRPQLKLEDQTWLEIPAPSLGKPLSDEERKHLLATESKLPAGDAARGKAVFNSAKATCSKCHRINLGGGQVGPDLSTIGRSRSRRDLLEAVLYPSASFVRGFAPYIVLTDDGQTHSGIILGEGSQELHLGIDKEKSAKISNRSVEEIHALDLSIMPQDVHRLLEQQELADLVTYLESLQEIQRPFRFSH